MRNTEITPGNVPKNAPAVGAKKSNKVNFTFDPRSRVKGICRAIRPKVVKIEMRMSCFFSIFPILAKSNSLSTRGNVNTHNFQKLNRTDNFYTLDFLQDL